MRVHMSDRDRRGHTEATRCSWTSVEFTRLTSKPRYIFYKGASLNIPQSLIHFKVFSCCAAAFKSCDPWPQAVMLQKNRAWKGSFAGVIPEVDHQISLQTKAIMLICGMGLIAQCDCNCNQFGQLKILFFMCRKNFWGMERWRFVLVKDKIHTHCRNLHTVMWYLLTLLLNDNLRKEICE